MITLQNILDRWDTGEGKPFKGKLIDMGAYRDNPDNLGCMCAQGQVLHLLGGWKPDELHAIAQDEADRAVAKLLGISTSHSILLRLVNDKAEGAPSVVLTAPEKILNDQTPAIMAFWRHLDRMTEEDWCKIPVNSLFDDLERTAEHNRQSSGRLLAGDAAWDAMIGSGGARAILADCTCYEIQNEQSFRFLPLFGFSNPEAVLAADERNDHG